MARIARPARGFTLIELIVTLAIVALLATAALPLAELGVRRHKEHELRLALRQIRTAIDEYKKAADDGRVAKPADASGYPPSLDLLTDGVVNNKDPAKRKIYFLRRMPADPFAEEADARPADTWLKRSYESGPDAPAPGKDVYDVRSTSTATAINGTPYAAW